MATRVPRWILRAIVGYGRTHNATRPQSPLGCSLNSLPHPGYAVVGGIAYTFGCTLFIVQILQLSAGNMNFYSLQSVIASQKNSFDMQRPMDSFSIAQSPPDPYIEPTFTKSEFDTEKPQVILVSAVGATGKSALAQVLSNRLKLPLLDLGKHKPVGDNTLTGLLTNAFSVQQLSPIFEGLLTGQYGVIVDGVDEGRSKTTEQAFQAFLDDIAKLCHGAVSPSFLLLGRTQILEECWLYLTEKGISTGLLTINPFDLSQARNYIDSFTDGLNSAQASQYQEARDGILAKLSTAFSASDEGRSDNFLSFIGYPPVLDAIVTLLHEERNYHRLGERLSDSMSNDMEIELLNKIAQYILVRERDEKVIPNIVEPLLADVAPPFADKKETIFTADEQCVRLVAHCLGEPISLQRISQASLNVQYEDQLAAFLPEHPFISGREFRNVIFEAVALAVLAVSNDAGYHDLALRYFDSRRHSYYLVYLLALIAPDGAIPLKFLRAVLAAALEFKATNAAVELRVIGPDLEEANKTDVIDVQIELVVGGSSDKAKTFSFRCVLKDNEAVALGNRLSSAYITLPCEVILGGGREIELTAPIEINALSLVLAAPSLILRTQPASGVDKHILFESGSLKSEVTGMTSHGVELAIVVQDMNGLQYPLIQHAEQKAKAPQDTALREKYLRLRKILTHFRSHSKGALAKYREKVENPRVAGNPVGEAVLRRLVSDGVLALENPLYFLQQEQVHAHLGITWPELRKGVISDKLLQYLRSIS